MHTFLHTYSTHRYTEKMNTITNITNTTQLANAFKQLNASHYDLVDSLTNSVDSLDVFKVEVDTMYLLICGTLVVFSKYQLPDL